MRNILFTLFLLLTVSVNGQNFEGKIVYENTFNVKTAGITAEQLTAQIGTKQDYYIKNGSYRSVFNGSDMQWSIYINSENRIYSKTADKNILMWVDAGSISSQIKDVKINKSVTDVLGYRCDEVIFETDMGVEKYYFSPKLGADPSLFVRHKFGNWYDLIKVSRSLPLKSIIDSPQVTYSSTATEITPMKLKQKDFILPKGMKSAKSTQ